MLRDRNGKPIEVGQTLKRVVEGKGVKLGHKYTVVQYDFKTGEPGEDFVADGGFQRELLWEDRAREYEIVDES